MKYIIVHLKVQWVQLIVSSVVPCGLCFMECLVLNHVTGGMQPQSDGNNLQKMVCGRFKHRHIFIWVVCLTR